MKTIKYAINIPQASVANESAICGCKNTGSGRAVHRGNIHIYIVQ
jgi:hypothetical protein